ncbi:MAG: T9SS type A sorting domain-containing protein [Bacteroidales bacterium]|nr:T9SS type A sorting domain-containing protein [Bacteroidales bacterium]MCF8387723.1 T9SS type A sorting domain-containing protein [Bacteroidales bacterium]MCF8397063.1 T9SS type A sorting domain-containing protein [Bacteroidales bacterium]
MKLFKNYTLLTLLMAFFTSSLIAQNYTYDDNWSKQGFTLSETGNKSVTVMHSVEEFSLDPITVDREQMLNISMPGALLPNDEGMPNLPGNGRFIAVPEGAKAKVEIISSRIELIKDVDIVPAPRIPWDTERGDLSYVKNNEVYSSNSFYPAKPVKLSNETEIRGLNVVMLGITPFQYNPVSRELKVYRDLEIKITFEGGSEEFGEERLRSRWFDPILQDAVLNHSSLPAVDYTNKIKGASRDQGCEYLIVVPNDAIFTQWADSIKEFRTKQGILTDIVTLDEIGGNSANDLEAYFDNAYDTWDIPPSAVLLLADYGSNASNRITSPIWDYYCVSDNIYADVNGNDMPDIVFARMTAQNADQLEVMITKFLDYERTPPTNPDFYNSPITALGWQTERWFQICSEAIGGYFNNVQGKNTVRINEVYEGNPSTDPWSTAPNTSTVLNYFGPNGLGYIPASPSELGNWSGGNANDVNNAINSGSFILQHRDHGYEYGWGEPDYNNNDIDGLNNTDLTFIMSVNCLTGKYNIGGECFAEKFHRYTHNGENSGALGLIAASEVSYSFVNDTYIWGVYDNMWTDFMPDYGTTPDSRGLMPAFGNAAGKYFLQASSWPYNTGNKEVTYNLFQHHGDAFVELYSEVPQDLTVAHNDVLLGGANSFSVTSDDGSFISLTVNGEIIGTAEGSGSPVSISIDPQTPGDVMIVTITKTNHYRYEEEVPVISPEDPYCIYENHTESDENGDGKMDYAETVYFTIDVKNFGQTDAQNVDVTLRVEDDEYITISDSLENYGSILSDETVSVDSGFMIEVAADVPDLYKLVFNVVATDGNETWNSSFVGEFYAPVLAMGEISIDDSNGDNNGRIDPGETVEMSIDISNAGSATAFNVMGNLLGEDEYIVIDQNTANYGDISGAGNETKTYTVTALETTPGGFTANFDFEIAADEGIIETDTFDLIIGQYSALILDLDPNSNSGPALLEAFNNTDLIADYTTDWPDEDLIIYKSIFLSLGVYYSDYKLTPQEGQILADYLDEGGNLYMEGFTTWQHEPQTLVHNMFGLEVIDYENWYEFENIFGQEDYFTRGMDFEYDLNNPYNQYYFEADEDGSFVILRSQDDYGCAVANDAGDYKTIAANFVFGGLLDGIYPSEKDALMQQYLEFFGVLNSTVGLEENTAGQKDHLTVYPNPATNQLTFKLNSESETEIDIRIYDVKGQLVKFLNEQNISTGMNEIHWDATDRSGNLLTPGLYFYQTEINDNSLSGKISIVK